MFLCIFWYPEMGMAHHDTKALLSQLTKFGNHDVMSTFQQKTQWWKIVIGIQYFWRSRSQCKCCAEEPISLPNRSCCCNKNWSRRTENIEKISGHVKKVQWLIIWNCMQLHAGGQKSRKSKILRPNAPRSFWVMENFFAKRVACIRTVSSSQLPVGHSDARAVYQAPKEISKRRVIWSTAHRANRRFFERVKSL